jgi:hypothetical protein
MPDGSSHRPDSQSHKRLLVAAKLQEIENNPLSKEERAMFEMFEHEGWSAERRRAYVIAQGRPRAAE